MLCGAAITEMTGIISRRTLYYSRDASGEHSVVRSTTTTATCRSSEPSTTSTNGRCAICGAPEDLERGESRENYAYAFIHGAYPTEEMTGHEVRRDRREPAVPDRQRRQHADEADLPAVRRAGDRDGPAVRRDDHAVALVRRRHGPRRVPRADDQRPAAGASRRQPEVFTTASPAWRSTAACQLLPVGPRARRRLRVSHVQRAASPSDPRDPRTGRVRSSCPRERGRAHHREGSSARRADVRAASLVAEAVRPPRPTSRDCVARGIRGAIRF